MGSCRVVVVALMVCGAAAGTARAGNLSVSPPALPMGFQSVSGGPKTGTVTLTNSGSDTTIVSFSLGPGCGEFMVTTPAGFTLASAESAAVSVEYDPVDRVADSCVITVMSDANNPSFTATGDGAAAELVVAPGPFDYGNVRWNGSAMFTIGIPITNNGEESVTGSQLSATLLTGGQGFTITGFNPPLPLAGGGAMTNVMVVFDPTSAGAKSDTLRITATNDPPADGPFDASLSGTGTQSSVTFSPSPLVFGNVTIGSPQPTNLAIGNDGLESLTITSMSITGTNASDFSFTDHGCSGQTCNPGVTIASMGAAENFAIQCSPSARGNRTATLSVVSDDPDPLTLTMTCRGQSSEITVSPTSLAFNPTRVGTSDTTQSFTISNAAQTTPATILGLTYDATEALNDYAITCNPACSGTLTPGASATITVSFTPLTTGVHNGNIVVMSDDPDEPTTNVSVTGDGTASQISAPATLAFGTVPVVGTGVVQSVTLTNNGTASLNTTTMTITGDSSFSFGFSSGLCQSGTTCTRVVTAAAGGGTAQVPIRCDPTTQGAKTGTLAIGSDAPGADPDVTVALTCTGAVSVMTATPSTLTSFGNQRVNTSSTPKTFTLGNAAGLAPLNYTVTRPATDFLVSVGTTSCLPTCTGQIAAGGSAVVSVTFRPASGGAKSSNVVVHDNDNFTADILVAVTGTGVEPLVALTAPVPPMPPSTGGSLAFGNVTNNTTSATQTITIENTGSMDLAVTGVTNTSAANFNLTGPSTATVPPGSTQSWTVACDPETIGAKSGTIQIANDSSNDTSVDVALTCTSIEGFLVPVSATPVAITGGNTIDFGPVFLNTMVMTTVTVENQGNVAATIASVTVSPTSEGFSVAGFTPNTTVGAGGSTTFTVTFLPTLDAQGMATLTINSEWNDPTLMLLGDGQPTGAGITPNPIAMGNVNWDGTVDQVVTVRNVATATFRLDGATLTGADAGEFQIIGFTAGNIAAGAMRTFTLRANPSDAMLGQRNATLVITTDLPAGMGDVTNVPVSYTSVGPAVSLDPGMTVDFGGVDVDDTAGSTITLTITNTGSGTMDILSVSGLNPPFSKTALASNTIAPATSQTITITYRPTVERDASNPEQQTFTVTTDGLYVGGSMQPASFQVTVRGHGIDRHVAVSDLTFPATFRNPTEAQLPRTTCRVPPGTTDDQPCSVQVCNSGAAELMVTMVTDPDDPFDVQSTDPFTVAGGTTTTPTCVEVAIDFRPPGYGPFDGTVTLVNDDNAQSMAVASLSGTGIPRPVAVPTELDVGDVPVEVEFDLRDRLAFPNSSPTHDIRVTDLVVTDAGAGVTLGLPSGGALLAAGTPGAVDATLRVDHEGDFTVTVEVYLDDDPESHASFTLRGRAVGRKNYYTCSTGRPGGALAPIGLIVAALVVRRRRRRARG